MSASGVPEVVSGVDVGFTDFSEFAIAAGVPSGITEFGDGVNSPDTVAIANDAEEGNYFSMDGHALLKGFAFGLDNFDGLIEFGEMLARVYFNVNDTNRSNLGPVFSLEGATDATLKFAGGSVSRPGDNIPQSDGKSEVTGTTFVSLNNNNIQEAMQNPAWMWFRIRRVQNGANDDWEGTAWYGAIEDEPASIDGSAIDVTTHQRGVLALGWGCVNFMSLSEQRIAYLSFSGDPDTVAPPLPGAGEGEGAGDAFPDTVRPMTVGDLWGSGALKDLGPSGLLQLRPTKAAGWSWRSTWPTMSLRNLDHQFLLAFLHQAWQRGRIFLVAHPLVPGSGLAPNGLGTSTVLVSGASQAFGVGEIVTDGWPVSTEKVARAGDVVKIDGDSAVYLVTENAESDGSGVATLKITPPLRRSPADNAAVATTDVLFRAVISARSELEPSTLPELSQGPSVTFTEALQ